MKLTLIVAAGLLSTLVVAGSGLALFEAVEIYTTAAEATADAASDFATQLGADVQAKANLAASAAESAASNAAGQANAATALGSSIASDAWVTGSSTAGLYYYAVHGFYSYTAPCAWEAFEPFAAPDTIAAEQACAAYGANMLVAA